MSKTWGGNGENVQRDRFESRGGGVKSMLGNGKDCQTKLSGVWGESRSRWVKQLTWKRDY